MRGDCSCPGWVCGTCTREGGVGRQSSLESESHLSRLLASNTAECKSVSDCRKPSPLLNISEELQEGTHIFLVLALLLGPALGSVLDPLSMLRWLPQVSLNMTHPAVPKALLIPG